MNPVYSINNNLCYNNNTGYISISSIEFTQEEQDSYSSYTILWSGDFDNDSIISADNLLASNLKAGLYTFQIVSLITNEKSELYSVEITSPSELKITEVKYSEYSCENSGYIYIEFTGGVAPYTLITSQQIVTTNENSYKFENLNSGQFSISIRDSNGCLYEYPSILTIKEGSINYTIDYIYTPKRYNDYSELELSVIGYGPFSFRFINYETKDSIYINNFNTKYLISINNNIYKYNFNNILLPGDYELIISNNYGCEKKIEIISLPNASPMSVSFSFRPDTSDQVPVAVNSQPILDTLLIPYELIKSNSLIWNLLKQKTTKDSLQFILTKEGVSTTYNFQIVRNLLDKYFINDGDIEILKLDSQENNWFFYFYIAPSINLSDNNSIDTAVQLKIDDNIFDITIGLGPDNNLDSSNPSLIIGSFIFSGLGYNQFHNGSTIHVNFTQPSSKDDYSFEVKNITKQSNSNLYTIDFVTIINFLEQFNVLNKNININKPSITKDDYSYSLNIKNLLKTINNFSNNQNQNTYLYNPTDINNDGLISLSITGNDFFGSSYDNYEPNSYKINYYFVPEHGSSLQSIYMGSNIVEDTNSISNIPNGFYIIKIKDKYNNTPQILANNGINISYDDHFIEAKKILQGYNSSILSYFNSGDILIYIHPEISMGNKIPSYKNIDNQELPDKSITVKFYFLQEQVSDNNMGSIYIQLLTTNIKCYIYGPKKYFKEFNTTSTFTDLVPGIYTIMGDEQDLKQASLYQNETRVLLEKGYLKEIFLSFNDYSNLTSIKE